MQNNLLAWYKIHFPPSSFDGRIQIGYRKSGQTKLKPLLIRDREVVEHFLETMYMSPNYDYYIMANTVTGVKRRKESLFTLQNIVIDIDNHGDDFSEESVKEFIWRLHRDWPEEMPKPTSVVETGRGIQLWWHILPVHAKCKPYFDEVREEFMRQIQILLDEYSSLDSFTIDSTASCNDVGYFRLPFSVNTKVAALAVATIENGENNYVLQDLVEKVKKLKNGQLDQSPALEKRPLLSEYDKKIIPRFHDSEISILKNSSDLSFFRMKQLISLRKIRNRKISLETRNNLNFMVYNTLLPKMSEEKAWEKLLLFNQGFKEPMTESELRGVIVTAKDKGGYKYSNEKMIKFLQITPGEQEKIGLYSTNDSKKQKKLVRCSHDPARDAKRAFSKEVRNQRIFSLAKTNMSLTEISEDVGVSVSTVSKVLGFSENKENKKKKAIKMLKNGESISAIVAETTLSRSTIKRLKSSICSPELF